MAASFSSSKTEACQAELSDAEIIGWLKIPYRKTSTIALQKQRKSGTNYFDSIAQFKYSGKNVDVYKTNSLHRISKAHYVLLF